MKGIQFRELVSKGMGKQESQIRTEEPRDCQKQETIADAEDGVRPALRDPRYTEESASPGFAGRRQHHDVTMADRKRERNPLASCLIPQPHSNAFCQPNSGESWLEGWGTQPVMQSTAGECESGCPANRARTPFVPQSI